MYYNCIWHPQENWGYVGERHEVMKKDPNWTFRDVYIRDVLI